LNDIKIDYPISKATIVSSKSKENQFNTQINRNTFINSDLSDICEFKSDKEIESVYHHLQEVKKIGV
jgi:hypothetical protein